MNSLREIKRVHSTPWKLFNEVFMIIVKPFVFVYLKIKGVSIDGGFKFYGFPKIMRHRKSEILIGKSFENRNCWHSNPLGINHPTIICTWREGAKIDIADDVGISGGSIVASKSVSIGRGTIIGANCTIIDTDFHPTKGEDRRYKKKDVNSSPVEIGKNVFIGMNSIILKGVNVPDNSVVPAGSVVHRKKYDRQS